MLDLGVTPYDQLPPYIMAPSPLFPPTSPFQQYNPFVGIDTGNAFFNMGLQMGGSSLLSGFGGTGLGFNHIIGGNLHNNIRMQVYSQQHNAMVQQLAMANSAAMMDSMRGAAALAGLNINDPEYQAAMQRMSQGIGYAAPFLPSSLLDTLTGGRNIAGMASGISLAGMNRYDPLTGRIGMPPTSAAAVAQGLYNDLGFSEGPAVWRQRTSGFGAGQIGDLYQEMSRRGLLSPESGPGPDLTRVKGQLENYTKALGAVREIFGDAGITNAPMQQLMTALENLTQGANYQMDPNRVNMSLRVLRETANAQGMGMSGAMNLAAAGNRYANQLGLVPTGVWTLPSTTDAINFGLGLNASGAMAMPGWGLQTPEQLMAQRNQLYLRNAASPIGNSMGAMARMLEQFGGSMSGRGRDALRNAVDDIRRGIVPSLGGTSMSDMSAASVREYVARTTGMSLGEVEEIFLQQSTNEEFLNKLGGGAAQASFSAARRELIDKIMGASGGTMYSTAAASVSRVTAGTAGSTELTGAIVGAARNALQNMPSDIANVTSLRNASMGGQIEQQLRKLAEGGNLAARKYLAELDRRSGDSGVSVKQQLSAMAGSMYGAAEQQARQEGLLDPNDRLINHLMLTAPDVMRAAGRQSAEVNFRAMVGDALSGKSVPDFFTRISQALQEAGQDPSRANFVNMAMRAMNIEPAGDMGKTAANVMGKLYDSQQQLDDSIKSLLNNSGDPNDPLTKQRVEQLKARREAVENSVEELRNFLSNPANAKIREEFEKARQSPDINGAAAGGTNASAVYIDTLRISGGNFELTMSQPKTEVEVSGGRGGRTTPAAS